jgi:hypothetical protein
MSTSLTILVTTECHTIDETRLLQCVCFDFVQPAMVMAWLRIDEKTISVVILPDFEAGIVSADSAMVSKWF